MFVSEPAQDAEVQSLYEHDRDAGGYVSNYLRVWAWRPDVYATFLQARMQLVSKTSLTDKEIAIVNATTAAARGDSYCSLAWGTKLAKLSDPATAAAVLQNTSETSLSERERALSHWARCVVSNPNGTSNKDVADLRRAGFCDQEIFEATFLAAARLAFTTVNDALGAIPDDALRDQAPAQVKDSVRFGR
jgi:uncharacterized peroxidase-related enzyme